jgi:hypothetical protein
MILENKLLQHASTSLIYKHACASIKGRFYVDGRTFRQLCKGLISDEPMHEPIKNVRCTAINVVLASLAPLKGDYGI